MAKSSTTFQPGNPIKGGRPKGSPNKRTLDLQKRIEELGLDPVQTLAMILDEQMKIFKSATKGKRAHRGVALEALADAERTASNLMQYLYPKKKAIEHTGEVGVKTFADFMAAAKGKP